jgi:ABC-type branched-subunit amino acid transport system substrate-binding protein
MPLKPHRFAAAVVCFLGIVLCGQLRGWAEAPLKVGVIVPLSGAVGSMGEAFRRGFELYARDNLKSQLTLLFEDDRYDGKAAVSALHKLREADQVDFVVVWGNTPSGACAPVAERTGMPMLAVSFNPDAKGRQHVISFGPKNERLVAKVVEQFKKWGLKTPAAVSIDIGSALLGVEMLRKQLNNHLLVKAIANEDVDFKSILLALRAKNVDGVFLLTFPEQALTFIRQAEELKYPLKIVGGDVFAEEAFRKQAVGRQSEITFVYGAVEPYFIAKLRDAFGESSYFFESAGGYAIATLLERLAAQRPQQGFAKEDPIKVLSAVSTDGLPIPGTKLIKDEDYGVHYETDSAVYPAD